MVSCAGTLPSQLLPHLLGCDGEQRAESAEFSALGLAERVFGGEDQVGEAERCAGAFVLAG